MRNALIRLAPCAFFLSTLASAQMVERPTTGGTNTALPAPVTGPGVNSSVGNLGGAGLTGPSTQGSLSGATPTPSPVMGAVIPATLNSGAAASAVASPLAIKPVGTAGAASVAPAAAVPGKAASIMSPGAAAPAKAAAGASRDAAPGAATVLESAGRGIQQGRDAEAAGGDSLSVRRALDRAYDSSVGGGNVGGASGVAGKFATVRETVARLVGVANNSAPADAPGLYASAIKTAKESLPAAAAAAVSKTVVAFAGAKAERSLSDLVQSAYSAASAGQSTEARRLVKSLDKWEEVLGVPGRPLISNADRIKAGVETALSEAAKRGGAKASAPRVWVVKRGASYVAALPGTTVEKVPGLAASFALKLESLAVAPMTDAYRAFVAAPGARSAYRARVSLGESVPSAALSTGWLWLKYLLLRAWDALTALLPGRSLPSAATPATLPRLRAAADEWRDASRLGDAAVRAAGSPRLVVSRARGAFELARRAAVAHESFTGRNGAVARVEALTAQFEAGVSRAALSPSDRLTPSLESLVSGEGGVRHWAALYAADARARGAEAFSRLRGSSPVVILGEGPAALAAANLSAASKELSYAAYGDSLWASGSGSYGAVKLAADLRSTESGGSVTLEAENGDAALANSLDSLGYRVTRRGRGLVATLDAQTVSADEREMTDLAADGAAVITGAARAPAPSADGISRLLADMRRSPKEAARAAATLDGRSWLTRAKPVGKVGDDEIVSTEIRSRGVRVIALRDAVTGLAKFARIEPLRAR